MIGFTLLWLFIVPSLPSVATLQDVELQVPLRIHSADDRLITTVGEQRRIPLTIDEIPLKLRQAFLAARTTTSTTIRASTGRARSRAPTAMRATSASAAFPAAAPSPSRWRGAST